MQVLSTKYFEKLAEVKMLSADQDNPFIYTERIENINLLEFYAKTSSFNGEKFFWRTPDKSLTMIGLGVAKEISVTGDYKEVEVEVRKFSNGNPDVKAFGGFVFEKTTGELWSSYGNGTFIIPRHLIVENGSGQYITTIIDEKCVHTEIPNETEVCEKNYLSFMVEAQTKKWKENVSELIKELNGGLLEKAVLARTAELRFHDKIRPYRVLKNLEENQSNCYLFSFEKGKDCFIGASPEKLVSLKNNQAYAACLAGTTKKADDEVTTKRFAKMLMEDEKNRSEHQFVVDLISEKFINMCNNVSVPDEPVIMVNKFIQHLYTPISGEIKEGKTILDFVEVLHPTPALAGTPTNEAMKRIRELEFFERGLFAAPIGWLDAAGNGDFAVGIRSGLIRENVATIFAGAGIVAESNVEEEYEETTLKFKPMINALCE